ncbi:capsular biosynthesis protein [Bacillus sp. V3B]|uniref:YveK family protein n=1 Tax=Bacillus sp. V3B TaxID=2804915 RepID=UPI002108C2BC|nr:Wzz/FepE/Etk N-terminal domain-containing protein [Bacillus sp. V3B]MCQ6275272.1 capsular biosynthesis protein [Bacillus sp. V3B]
MNRLTETNQTMEKSMAKEINLKEIFAIIKKRLWMVAALTILFAVIGYTYNQFSTTLLYQSSSRIIIKAGAEERTTLQVIMRDSTIMEKVAKELQLERSSGALAGQITVQSIDTSQVVSISVVDTDPEMAANIANTTAKIFKAEIPNIVGFKDVQLLSDAQVNPYPINDNGNRTMIISIVLGLVAGIGLVFFLDSLDDSIQSGRDVEDYLGIPVLGKVSKMKKRNFKKKNQAKQEVEFRGETIGTK